MLTFAINIGPHLSFSFGGLSKFVYLGVSSQVHCLAKMLFILFKLNRIDSVLKRKKMRKVTFTHQVVMQ